MIEPQDELANRAPADQRSRGSIVRFGPFSLDLARRLLFEGETRVRLGSRAIAILAALVEKAGGLATKEELVRIAWPETFVEEVNLRVHLSAIRRALRDSAETPTYIANVSGRGYRFIAPLSGTPVRTARAVQSSAPLPGALVQLIGRDDSLLAVADMTRAHRLVTIVGPGGMGKTTLAAEIARRIRERFADGVAFVDLVGLTDGAQLAARIVGALGLPDDSNVSLETLGHGTPDLDRLVLLDGCEQLIDAAALVAESLLRAVPGTRILATSSEPLRAANEHVYRLPPLDLPPSDNVDLGEALSYSAIRMLVDRIRAGDESVRFTDRDARLLVAISRRLDGLPLAIDMAAARIQVFGLHEVRERLDHGIEFLVDLRRTGVVRHRSMRGLLESNHDALTEDERVVLRRLAVFAGAFDLSDAGAVVTCAELTERRVVAAMSGLVAKSQLVTSRDATLVRYRLTRTLRTYAREHLTRSREFAYVAENHARLILARVASAIADWSTTSRAEWLESHGELAEEVREAMSWCFAQPGREALAAELTALAAPVLLRSGHYAEMRRHARSALKSSTALSPELRFRLHLLLATLTEDHVGPITTDRVLLAEAARLRDTLADPGIDAEFLLAKTALALRTGKLNHAATLAHRAADAAARATLPDLERTADRLAAEAHHYAGDHAQASRHLRALLTAPDWRLPAPAAILTSPHKGALRVIEARQLWLMGRADQARHLLFEALNFAAEDGPWPLCEAIALGACSLLLWCGEDDRAATYIVQLEREAEHAGFPHWLSWAALYRNVLLHRTVREGRRSEGTVTVQPTSYLQAETWVTLTGSLRGLAVAPDTVSGWCRPEVIRATATTAALTGDIAGASDLFEEAIRLSRTQGALAWELRATTGLARLWRDGRNTEAHDRLEDVLGRFAEGFGTSDVLAARALLRQLGATGV